MPSHIPPTGNAPPPVPGEPPSKKSKPDQGKDATPRQTLNDLLSQCTPEEKKKFYDLLIQNLVREIKKDQDKAIKQMRKIREHPENPDEPD